MKGLVFAASSDLFGSDISVGKKGTPLKLYKKDLIIVGGLKEKESIDILRQFFRAIRKKRKGDREAEGSITRKGKK